MAGIMEICEFCGKKNLSKPNRKNHLVKYHKIKEKNLELVKKNTIRFFSSIEMRKWSVATTYLERIKEIGPDKKWIKGYTHALAGMFVSLKGEKTSTSSFILNATNYDNNKLKKEKKRFNKAIQKEMNTKFDRGYFKAWRNYINYLIQKN
jgi:hypothetical protein